MQSTRSFLLAKQFQSTQTNFILKTPDAYPKRPKSAVLISGERLTKAKKLVCYSYFIPVLLNLKSCQASSPFIEELAV